MKSFARHILSLIAFLASLSVNAQADIYQFVDDSGVVHFTNAPGGQVKKFAKVHVEPRGPATSSNSARTAPPARTSQRTEDIPVSYVSIINSACERFGVDPSLVHAIVKVESDFNPFAISRKGAMGLMQLMPQTASTMNVRNTFSPHENIEGGVKYLRYLLDRYEGNLTLSLAAYNSGETAVKKWGTVPPFKETQDYVKKIMQIYNGTGKSFAPRYTIYVGTSADGTILLTDNPSNHPDKKLHRKMGQSL
jgi:soluble lytic murein transglycosylase-like protein